MTIKNELTETQDILAEMMKSRAMLKKMPRTAPKIAILKKIFLRVLQDVPEETKLPTVRALSEALGVTLVPVQKVITLLTQDDVLVSKPRSGVYVGRKMSDSGVNNNSKDKAAAYSPFSNTIHFFTDSVDDYQRPMWQQLQSLFNRDYNNIDVNIEFNPYSRIDSANKPDVLECAGYGWQEQIEPLSLLALEPFCSTGGSLLSKGSLYGDCHVPLYYRTYFLLYNPALLERYKIPFPNYTSFPEQLAYIKLVNDACSRVGLAERMFSITEPVTLIGDYLNHFLDLATGRMDDPSVSEQLTVVFDQVMTYLRECDFAAQDAPTGFFSRDFLTGKNPFFIGYSNTLWELENQFSGFEWKVYPIFTVDGACVKWPILGAVASDTKYPIEAIKYLSFLLRDECQKVLTANNGMIPVSDTVPFAVPFDKQATTLFKQAFDSAKPLFLESNSDFYLANSILNNGFWEARDTGRSGKDILENSLFMAKALSQST